MQFTTVLVLKILVFHRRQIMLLSNKRLGSYVVDVFLYIDLLDWGGNLLTALVSPSVQRASDDNVVVLIRISVKD